MATKTRVTRVSGADIVADARRYLGVRYVFGGGPPAPPRLGLDCSGLVEQTAFDVGIMSCPRTSEEQWLWVERITVPEPGCLVFFVGSDGEPGNPGHVGIVVDNGNMIDAPHTGTVVQESGYSTNGTGVDAFVGYGRMRGASSSRSANPNVGSGQGAPPAPVLAGIGVVAGGLLVFLFFAAIVGAIIFGALLLARA